MNAEQANREFERFQVYLMQLGVSFRAFVNFERDMTISVDGVDGTRRFVWFYNRSNENPYTRRYWTVTGRTLYNQSLQVFYERARALAHVGANNGS